MRLPVRLQSVELLAAGRPAVLSAAGSETRGEAPAQLARVAAEAEVMASQAEAARCQGRPTAAEREAPAASPVAAAFRRSVAALHQSAAASVAAEARCQPGAEVARQTPSCRTSGSSPPCQSARCRLRSSSCIEDSRIGSWALPATESVESAQDFIVVVGTGEATSNAPVISPPARSHVRAVRRQP